MKEEQPSAFNFFVSQVTPQNVAAAKDRGLKYDDNKSVYRDAQGHKKMTWDGKVIEEPEQVCAGHSSEPHETR